MDKIPFDINKRPEIEAGKYEVETRDGRPVRIICWDRVAKKNTDADLNLCVLVPEDKGESVYYYHQSGKKWVSDERYDLFLITPEPELTDFESRLCEILDFAWKHKDTIKTDGDIIGDAKRLGPELLALARKELQPEKDLPRWKKANGKERFNERLIVLAGNNDLLCTNYAEEGEYYISFSDLEKLPKG